MADLGASAEEGFFGKRDNHPDYDPAAIGLCFSGGGYRATLFHAGALLRMNELGLLGRATRIASVSGGSIATGVLAMNWEKLEIGPDAPASAEAMRAHLIDPVLRATGANIDLRVGIEGLIPFVSAGARLAAAYDRAIFGGFALKDAPETPEFVFCATNLQTGGLFRFTKTYLEDWKALRATTRHVRLSEAVAASSAFPPVLSPLRLDLSREETGLPHNDYYRYDDPALRRRPVLVDGGVYDNLGLEAVWRRCGVIFSAYAGRNMPAETGAFPLDHLMPVIFRFLESSIDWRERVLVRLFQHRLGDGLYERAGASWSAEAEPVTYRGVASGWTPPQEIFDATNAMSTRLKAFPRETQRAALLAGYALADKRIRSFTMPDAAEPKGPPEALDGV